MNTASIILRRMAQVAKPGVIVSTIVTRDGVETVTFANDRAARLGFTTKVERSRDERDADAMHALAMAVAR